MTRHWTDGLWGQQIKEQAARRNDKLSQRELLRLQRIATEAQAVIPGPWLVSEANFVVCGFVGNDPETGRAVAEIDCYNEHLEQKRAYIAALDPDTCLKLIRMAKES